MGKFRFYHVREEYIEFLHKFDSRVLLNKGEKRPYVGVVLSVSGFDYYVPLESPKPNHANIRSGGPVLKLDEGKLGIMGFNNMIPVRSCCLIAFDIMDEKDERYRALLLNQLAYCDRNKDLIIARANKTYEKESSGKNPFYRKVCCDFKRLENVCGRFKAKEGAK